MTNNVISQTILAFYFTFLLFFMTNADFKTLCDWLGINAPWLEDCGAIAVHARTTDYWLNGRFGQKTQIPSDILDAVYKVEAWSSIQKDILTDYWADQDFKDVVLIRFRNDDDFNKLKHSATEFRLNCAIHNTMIMRVWAYFRDQGISCTVESLEVEIYLAWLGAKKDTQQARLEWARAKIKEYSM